MREGIIKMGPKEIEYDTWITFIYLKLGYSGALYRIKYLTFAMCN
jgi:hypothetical protein